MWRIDVEEVPNDRPGFPDMEAPDLALQIGIGL